MRREGGGRVRRQPTSQDDGSVRCSQLFVTEGEGGLAWRRTDCRALHLFKRGDRLPWLFHAAFFVGVDCDSAS
jgi:hypothetical protein